MSIKDKIRSQLLKLGVAASTLAPMAPTSAEAATPEAPEQPKTEQYAPNQELDNNDGKTSNGFRLTPIDPNSPEARKLRNGNTNTQTNTNTRTRTNTTTRQTNRQSNPNNLIEGTPEWARANGWVYDPVLSDGLNRLGASDGSHKGYQGAYCKASDPDQVMFLPNDPRDGVQYGDYKNSMAAREAGHNQYNHYNHDKHGYGCPDQKRTYGNGYGTPHRGRPSRAERIVHGAVTVGAIIDAATRSGR
ncbi:MAG: hypothetical protein J6B00_00015 [Alphaproteobacteria bacterium]|nr:hypothetical protein [Alphaproteobacteria bacterium]MBP3686799.1 hypothetical protein [Alphaproteobacteria bacterium]